MMLLGELVGFEIVGPLASDSRLLAFRQVDFYGVVGVPIELPAFKVKEHPS